MIRKTALNSLRVYVSGMNQLNFSSFDLFLTMEEDISFMIFLKTLTSYMYVPITSKEQKSKSILIEYGADKQQKTFDTLVDTVVIEGLDAGTGYEFSVYTLDHAGNRSVPASITALPVAKDMAENLVPPTCTYTKVNGAPAIHWVTLSAVSMTYCKKSYIEYSVTSTDGTVVKQGVIKNEKEESVTPVNNYTLPAPELEIGEEYKVDFAVHVYPISSNILTMDTVPVKGSTRIVVE